jgi:tetratricopeptide (TPR) repeat protein
VIPRTIGLALLLAAFAVPAFAAPNVSALIARADAAYARRDAPGALDEVRARLAEAERLAPDDYEVLWRLARLQFWIADDPSLPGKEKSRAGKLAWEYGDRAARAAPDRVEGWYFAAAGVGLYALGIGVFQALREGIEGEFKRRLRTAEKIDPGYMGGAIETAWGRFYFKAPWPKYDARKSERAYLGALKRNPDNVRAHAFLAELYRKEGQSARARAELEKALAHPPGRYDGPEERRAQGFAREMLDQR